ncbi:hypothetical protein [Pseudofrankia asymbiotica]|uniref:hypothetical protein n=1 Tax=Pseudofrankia asymbiotica TaxID=1834516 RepID=UPI0010541338|nr:hypothetical protein [Pseudofrankia asymbiotica]
MDTTLDRVAADDVAVSLPVREFRWYQGRRRCSGWYWSSTLSRLVIYEGSSDGCHQTFATADGFSAYQPEGLCIGPTSVGMTLHEGYWRLDGELRALRLRDGRSTGGPRN